jgi:hypothetical protein
MNFSLPSDSPQRFTVQSNLIYAIWKAKAAYANCDAMFEIRTSFVGEGAQVKIKGKTENGKNLGSMDATMYGNRLIGFFPLPQNAPPDDFAYLEVKLPKQSLRGETNRIPIRPQIKVQQMQWSTQQAQRGDTLTLTVDFQSAIPNDTDALIIIYEYDPSGSHDPICKIPTTIQNNKIKVQWEFQYHNDTGEIPTHQELQPHGSSYAHPEYFFVVVLDEIRIGANQESGLLRFKDGVGYTVYDEGFNILPNEQFKIQFADGSSRNGTTDANGVLNIAAVPPGKIVIEFPNKQGYTITVE